MGRRRAIITQDDVFRIIQGYRKAGLSVRTRVTCAGIDFEPYEPKPEIPEDAGQTEIEGKSKWVL